MISATEALQLNHASISTQDREDVQAIVAKLDEHIRKHMTFGGPTPLEVPYKHLSRTASQIFCFVMKRLKWTVSLNLMAEQPRFQGGTPVPHHWVIQLVPMVEVYEELLADFEIEPKIQLM